MPMMAPEDFGTNAGCGSNKDYCRYCFQNGKFTWPDATLDQMIEKLASMHDLMEMTEDEARKVASENLPKLKRWSTQ